MVLALTPVDARLIVIALRCAMSGRDSKRHLRSRHTFPRASGGLGGNSIPMNRRAMRFATTAVVLKARGERHPSVEKDDAYGKGDLSATMRQSTLT
jgi:hypothetical protein